MFDKLIIIGASGHGKVVADAALAAGFDVIGFLDDAAVGTVAGFDILGTVEKVEEYKSECCFIVAVGNNFTRRKIVEKIAENYGSVQYAVILHPRACISESVMIKEGSVVMAGAVINADAKIGAHCIINTLSAIEHDCTLGDYVHISPRAALSGTVDVGELTHVGTGAAVRNNLNIAERSVIGVGSAVVKNIDVSGVYCGVPAKKLIK